MCKRLTHVILIFIVLCFFQNLYAVPAGGGGGGDTNEDLKGVCEMAGGSFTSV